MKSYFRPISYFAFLGLLCCLGFVNNSDLLKSLKAQKIEVDRGIKQKKLRAEVYVQEVGKKSLTLIKGPEWPKAITTIYKVWKDKEGKTGVIYEIPFGKGGDYRIEYKHYFDKDGKTFAFQRKTNFFNSICTDETVYERLIKFYDTDFQLLKEFYSLKDGKGSMLEDRDCTLNYDFEYQVETSLDDYLMKYIRTE